MAWDLELPGLGRKPVHGMQEQPGPDPRAEPRGGGGHCWRLLKQRTRSHSTTVHTLYMLRVQVGPVCPTVRLHSEAEVAEAKSSYQP